MISARFRKRRAFAQAIFATGMLLGGLRASQSAAFWASIILGHVFYLAALAGLLPGLAILWIEDPPRGVRTVVPF